MRFLQNRVAVFLFGAVLVTFLISLPNRVTSADESILAEQAYWLAEAGIVKSKVFAGMGQGWEFLQLHYHKLFIWIGALAIKVFGFTWYLFKIIPLVFLILFLFLFDKFLKREGLEDFKYLAFAILIINYFIFFYSFYFRPEVVQMFFGFLSYYLLTMGLKKSQTYVFIAGILAAACALIHLNGLMFLAAGGILLLVRKEFKLTLLFSAGGVIGLFFYFIEILSVDKFQLFLDQLLHDPNIKDDSLGFFHPFKKVLNEHQRLFRGPKEITMTAFPLVALIFNFRFLKKNYFNILIYTATLIIFLAIVAHGITPKYSLVYYPFFILIFLYSFKNNVVPKYYPRIISGLVVVYVITQAVFLVPIFTKSANIPKRSEHLSSFIDKKHAKVLATDTFIFDQLPNYDINSFLGYRYKRFNYEEFNPDELPASDLFEFARFHERDYILVYKPNTDPRVLHIMDFENLEKGKNYNGYFLIEKGEDYAAFRYEQ